MVPRFVLHILLHFAAYGTQISLQTDVDEFALEIDNFANINLGAKKCQEHFDKLSSQSHDSAVDAEKILFEFINNLNEKTKIAKRALEELHQVVLDGNTKSGKSKELQSCCTFDDTKAKYEAIFNGEVDVNEYCVKGNAQKTVDIFRNEEVLTEFIRVYNEESIVNHVRDIHYGAADGYSILYPARLEGEDPDCSAFDPRYQEWYKSTLNRELGKDIVLIVDFTESMKEMEEKMRYVVRLLLSIVDTKDRISLKLYYGKGRFHSVKSTGCLTNLTVATPFHKKKLQEDIDGAPLSGVTIKYVEIFDKAFDLFEENNRAKQFIFVTSGNYGDKDAILKESLQQKDCLHNITTYIILLQSTRSRPTQIFHKELTLNSCTEKEKQSVLIHIQTDDDSEITIRDKLAAKLVDDTTTHSHNTDDVHFTMPYGDNLRFGVLINACRKVVSDEKVFLGILCVSFITNELVGGSSDFPQSEDFYRFLTDTSGTTYMHLNYREPTGSENVITRLDITRFETSPHFQEIYTSIKRGESGSKSFLWNTSISRGLSGAVYKLKNYTYHWVKVENSQFVIGVVISSTYRQVEMNTTGLGGVERYHRLDLWDTKNTKDYQYCTVDDDVLVKGSSIIKFSPDSFERPSIYSEKENAKSIEDLMKYFGKEIKFTPPTFLFRGTNTMRDNLRQSVISTHFLEAIWMDDTTPESSDILSRYIGMETGLFRVYPGFRYHQNYDPRVRGWYQLAVGTKDKIVFTQPYLGAGTQLVVLTLSKAIYKGKGTSRQVIGVIGMDFLLPHLQKIVQRNLKMCSVSVRCVLIDRSGIVIYHDNLMKRTIKDGDIFQLAEFEPRVTQSLIARRNMTKQHCVQYSSEGSLYEWFYSLDNIEGPMEVKEKDLEYWITPISSTNVLLLKIHGSQDEDSPKCSVSRQCSSSSNKLCSCLDYNVCFPTLKELSSNELICKASDHRNTSFNPHWYEGNVKDLPSCYDCGKMRTSTSCEARLSCQWCAKYSNGSTAEHDHQYCTLNATCFPQEKITKSVDSERKKFILIIVVLCIIIVLLIGVIIWRNFKTPQLKGNYEDVIPNVQQTNNNHTPMSSLGVLTPRPEEEEIFEPCADGIFV